jgi:hypothetical protein
MQKIWKKYSAIFMITLILLIPLNFSIALAQIEVRAYGQDEVDGAVRGEGDNLNVWLQTEDSLLTLADVFVWLNDDTAGGKLMSEMSNAQKTPTLRPILTATFGDTPAVTTPQEDTVFFNVSGETYNKTIIYDYEKPRITNVPNIPQQAGAQGTITAILVEDTAQGSIEKCIGINRVEVRVEGVIVGVNQLNTSSCKLPVSVDYNLVGKTTTGTREMCVIAYDNAEHGSDSRCRQVEVDLRQPIIHLAELTLDGHPTSWFRQGFNSNSGVLLNISDPRGIATAKVSIPELAIGDLELTCEQQDNTTICTANIGITVTEDMTVSLQYNVTNNIGVSATATLAKQVGIDTEPPQITLIESDRKGANRNFIGGPEATITATIIEKSAIAKQNAKITIPGVPGIPQNTAADGCFRISSETWHCSWTITRSQVLNINARTKARISITDGTGMVSSPVEQEIYVDTTAPKFVNVTIKPISTAGMERDAIIPGDTIQITAYLNDTHGIGRIYYDVSQLDRYEVGIVNITNCVAVTNTTHQCSGTLADVDPAPIRSVQFFAEDYAGNTDFADERRYAEIRVIEVGLIPGDLFTGVTVLYNEMPLGGRLNRNLIAEDFNTGTFKTRVLVSTIGTNEVYSFMIDSCKYTSITGIGVNQTTSETTVNTDRQFYLGSSKARKYFILEVPGFETAFLKTANSIQAECSARILGGVAGVVAEQPERENFTIDFRLEGNLDQGPGATVINKFKETEEKLANVKKHIKWMNEYVQWVGDICSVIMGARSIVSGLINIMFACQQIPVTASACKSGRQAMEKIEYYLDKLYAFGIKGVLDVEVICNSVYCSGTFLGSKLSERIDFGDDVTGELGASALSGALSSWDNKNNIAAAILSWPPCVPGILSFLKQMKEAYIYQNACLLAESIGGSTPEKQLNCERMVNYVKCTQIMGPLFSMLTGLISGLIEGIITLLAEKYLEDKFQDLVEKCEVSENEKMTFVCATIVMVVAAKEAYGIYREIREIIDILNLDEEESTKEEDRQQMRDIADEIETLDV